MSILAFSSPSRVFRDYFAGAESVVTTGNGTITYTLTVQEDGVLQAISAAMNVKTHNIATPSGIWTFQVKRNNTLISSVSVSVSSFIDTGVGGPGVGLMYYDNFAFLAGAEVQAGEVFTFTLTLASISGAWSMTHDDRINMTVAGKRTEFSI